MSRDIDAETLRQWLEDGRPLTILDVRPAQQRTDWAIPGSVHADVYEAVKAGNHAAVEALSLPQDIPVVTVCAMGRISKKAADILEKKGMQTYSLAGGMQAWSLSWNIAEVPLGIPGSTLLQIRRAGKGCLSYLLASGDEALVIDPSLQSEVYLSLAEKRGVRIKAVLDTHMHADHFSRAKSLATLVAARTEPLSEVVGLKLGSLVLTAMQTPGHTPESTCFLLDGHALFTGDTLFLDSVGRPDLLAGLDPREQSMRLYQSIRRLSRLPEGTWVLPGHFPSPPAFDGIPIAATLGKLRQRNKYLQAAESDFLAMVLADGNAPPPNFETIVESNRTGILPEGDWQSLEAGPNRCARA